MPLGWIVLTLTAVGLAAALGAAWLALASVRIDRAQDEAADPRPPQPTAYSREAAHPSRVGYAVYHLHRYREHRRRFARP
jgi:hypothetical protein